ncbi:MAG: hypothetical protein H6862_03885 [Rhodospirillales bacterium]|nr:hypothetical protein [Rhodospirillales bacterium]
MRENNDNDPVEPLLRAWTAPPCRAGFAEGIITTILSCAKVDPFAAFFPPAAFVPTRARPWFAAGCAAACLVLGLFAGLQIDLSTDIPAGTWESLFALEEDPSWL